MKVDSWKEYKRILKETSAEKLLLEGPGRVLWRGHTVPLIKPGMAASTRKTKLLASWAYMQSKGDSPKCVGGTHCIGSYAWF